MANQSSNRPPFCDFLERYQSAFKPKWSHSQLATQRVGMGRFDEWLTATGCALKDLNWQKLLEFHRFVAANGVSAGACQRSVQVAKHALRWGIENGELPQQLDDIYTANYACHKWNVSLPDLSTEYLSALEPTRPGSYRQHRYAHVVFHYFLNEKKLSYRQLKIKHLITFIKYLNSEGLHPRTRMTISRNTRSYLLWLYSKRKIKRHPDDLLPAHLIPKVPNNLPRPIDPEIDSKMQQLLENTDDLYYKSFLLLRRTGLRISELRKLVFECIQVDQKDRCSLIVPPIKLGIERRVPLDAATVALVKQIQSISVKSYKKKTLPKYLIICDQGTPPRYERFSAALAEICARLGVKKWINPHAFRHTYATSMLNAGLTITSLKEILGHKAINMSLLYAKVSPEKIHSEYSEALLKMSDKHIPRILEAKSDGPSVAFADLSAAIAKTLDGADLEKQKRLKALRSRLAKLKMDLQKEL